MSVPSCLVCDESDADGRAFARFLTADICADCVRLAAAMILDAQLDHIIELPAQPAGDTFQR